MNLKNVIITCDGTWCSNNIEIKVEYTEPALYYYPKKGEKYYCTSCKRNKIINSIIKKKWFKF